MYQTGPGHEETRDDKSMDTVNDLPGEKDDELLSRQPVDPYCGYRDEGWRGRGEIRRGWRGRGEIRRGEGASE